jgi:hypothetical protein
LEALLKTNKECNHLDIDKSVHDPVNNIVNGESNDDDLTDEEKGKYKNVNQSNLLMESGKR